MRKLLSFIFVFSIVTVSVDGFAQRRSRVDDVEGEANVYTSVGRSGRSGKSVISELDNEQSGVRRGQTPSRGDSSDDLTQSSGRSGRSGKSGVSSASVDEGRASSANRRGGKSAQALGRSGRSGKMDEVRVGNRSAVKSTQSSGRSGQFAAPTVVSLPVAAGVAQSSTAVTAATVGSTTTPTLEEKEAAFEAKLEEVDLMIDMNSEVEAKFAACMDRVCKHEVYGRCYCDNAYKNMSPKEKEIKSLEATINKIMKEDVARAKMTEEQREFYDKQIVEKVKVELGEEDEEEEDFSLDDFMDDEMDYADTASKPKSGKSLFKEGMKICGPILAAAPADAQVIEDTYQNIVIKSCDKMGAALDKKISQLESAYNKAQRKYKEELFNTYSKKLDNIACLKEMDKQAQKDTLCGGDYEMCKMCNGTFTGQDYAIKASAFDEDGENKNREDTIYSGCTGANLAKLAKRKAYFTDILKGCKYPESSWAMFLIKAGDIFKESARVEEEEFVTEARHKKYDVADDGKKALEKCLKSICGQGGMNCTSKSDQASKYGVQIVEEDSAKEACYSVYARYEEELSIQENPSVTIDQMWASVWQEVQGKANVYFQENATKLMAEGKSVIMADHKFDTDIRKSELNKETDIKVAEMSVQYNLQTEKSTLETQRAKAFAKEAEAKMEQISSVQKMKTAQQEATMKRACEATVGVWTKGKCIVTVIAYANATGTSNKSSDGQSKELTYSVSNDEQNLICSQLARFTVVSGKNFWGKTQYGSTGAQSCKIKDGPSAGKSSAKIRIPSSEQMLQEFAEKYGEGDLEDSKAIFKEFSGGVTDVGEELGTID